MIGLYFAGTSLIHRVPAGVKLLLLCAMGIGLFHFTDWRTLLAVLLAVVLLYPVARLPVSLLVRQFYALAWLLTLLVIFQWWVQGWQTAIATSARLAALLLLANLITLTTRTTAIIDALTRVLSGLRFIGVNPARVSLAISLALRFLPVIIDITHEVRAAQKARGLEFSLLATAVPVIVRTLKMADDIADAIDARQG